MVCCFSCVLVILIVILIVKVISRLSIAWNCSPTCLVGKTTIVTGANTGIGFYTALDFAKRGARVILACRNKDKAEEAQKKIIKQTGNSNVVVRIVDLTSLASVREFAKEIKETESRLDILVNNAGAGGLNNITTKDDLLKKSAPSRIVSVSSAAAYYSKLDPNNLNAWPNGRATNYNNTKLCNILFTNELARRLKGTGVTVNSVHPGIVQTEIFRRMPFVMKQIVHGIIYLFFKTAEEGAQTTIYVAVSKEVEGVAGEYFDNCRIAWLPPMPKLARDEGLAKKVWEQTEECVKLTPEERQLLMK